MPAQSTSQNIRQPDNTKTAAQLFAELAKPASMYQTTEENRSRRILRQGVYQHTLVSPALAGLQFRGADEFLVIVKDVAEKVIKFIEEK